MQTVLNQKFLFVQQGDYAVVLRRISVQHFGIHLLHVHVGALGELLQVVQLGVAGLVHKENAVDAHGVVCEEAFNFLDSADGYLRSGIGIAYSGHDIFLFEFFLAESGAVIATEAAHAIVVWSALIATVVVFVETHVGLRFVNQYFSLQGMTTFIWTSVSFCSRGSFEICAGVAMPAL